MKVICFHTENGDHLLIITHHLVIDGVSCRILLEDFMSLYHQAEKEKRWFCRQKRTLSKNGQKRLNDTRSHSC